MRYAVLQTDGKLRGGTERGGGMIAPHGGTLVNRIVEGREREILLTKADDLPRVELDAGALSDLEMIGIGAYSPLEGFMTRRDYESVVFERRLAKSQRRLIKLDER